MNNPTGGRCMDNPRIMHAACYAMGTEFELWLCDYDCDATYLRALAETAIHELERLERRLSIFIPDSDISWLNVEAINKPVRIDEQLFSLLTTAKQLWAETDGAFDITVMPLLTCWNFYDGSGRMPSDEEINEALQCVGMQHVLLNESERTVAFDIPGIMLDLGGIGKGFAIDCIVALLAEHEIDAALIHGGWSTIYALGAPPNEDAWTVHLPHPNDASREIATFQLRDVSVSSASTLSKAFTAGKHTYGHVIDPRTGYPVDELLAAIAIAPTATESDALSTAFLVLGLDGTRSYCERRNDIGAMLFKQSSDCEDLSTYQLGIAGRFTNTQEPR